MRNIAITGSFASGKTHIMNYIKKFGYKIFSCDEYVKLLYLDQNITDLILQEIDELDVFDKARLARLIYNDDLAAGKLIRGKLEKIIHPLVMAGIKNFEIENKDENLIFTEVPLLFESGFDRFFNKIICVYCSLKTREERAKVRLTNNPEFFEQISKIQLSQNIKMAKSDFTINSEGNIEEEVLKIIKLIK